jgi:hypothetical protein
MCQRLLPSSALLLSLLLSWLLAQALPEDRTLWMQAVLVHEIAHCWRWQQGHDPSLQAPAQEEAFADVAALRQVQRQGVATDRPAFLSASALLQAP